MTLVWGTIQVSVLGVLVYIIQYFFNEKLKSQLSRENEKVLEHLKWEYRKKEQAAKVSEYLSLAMSLDDNSTKEEFRKANQLAYELALWLPKDIYSKIGKAIGDPTSEENFWIVLNETRKFILENDDAGLTMDAAIRHDYSHNLNSQTEQTMS